MTKYSLRHRFQKRSASSWTLFHCALKASLSSKGPGGSPPLSVFWVRRVYGVRMNGYSGLVGTGTSGLELKMALASVKTLRGSRVSTSLLYK